MSDCPSRLELSRWEASFEPARTAELSLHVEACGRCSAIVADISEARALLLGSNPGEAATRAARVILETARQRRAPRRWLRFLAPVLLVPAAAALLFFVRPVTDRNVGSTKGGLIVEAYCNREGKVFAAADGADFLPGDRLRFAYTQDRPGFLLVFGVDDTGQIFPYYDQSSLTGIPVGPGAKVFLPDAVELDGHKGWERIYFVWTASPIPDGAVRAAVTSSLAKANGDVRFTSALDLPVEQVSLLLRRP